MKNWIVILMVLIIPLSVFIFLENTTNAKNADNISMNGENKGKLIKFSSPLCGECKKVGQTITLVIPDYDEEIVFEEVNVSDDKNAGNMISKYQISVVPTLVFIDKNGKVVEKSEGVVEESYVRENLDKIK